MNRWIMTVGDLRNLLKDQPDDKPLAVMATPDVNGWANHLLAVTGTSPDAPHLLLALAEETANSDEIGDVTFTSEDGQKVRPV